MTRREVLLSAVAAPVLSAAAPPSKMAVEGYIFQQHAELLKQPLQAIVPQVLPLVRAAGFKNMKLNPSFFPLDGRDRVLAIIKEQGLRMPSLYVGGPMHEIQAAARTIAAALEFGALCAPFGCNAIVTNPDPKRGEAPKTDAELTTQANALNHMGRVLKQHGFELRVHHHTPQLARNAREWRHILQNTNPADVYICVDVDWAYEGGFEPVQFLRDVGLRLREIHVRSARNKVWLEDLEDSDIDYRVVASYLKQQQLTPLIVVELAYRPGTNVTRTLQDDLTVSRTYAERVFKVKADRA